MVVALNPYVCWHISWEIPYVSQHIDQLKESQKWSFWASNTSQSWQLPSGYVKIAIEDIQWYYSSYKYAIE
jgi:hypothetical protein